MYIEFTDRAEQKSISGSDLLAGGVYKDADGDIYIADDEGGVTNLEDGTTYRDVAGWTFVSGVNAKLVITG